MKEINFTPNGVCSKNMKIIVENNKIVSIDIIGGCQGYSHGVMSLLKGMDIDYIIERFDGVKCGFKSTSCPDQIAKALKQLKKEN